MSIAIASLNVCFASLNDSFSLFTIVCVLNERHCHLLNSILPIMQVLLLLNFSHICFNFLTFPWLGWRTANEHIAALYCGVVIHHMTQVPREVRFMAIWSSSSLWTPSWLFLKLSSSFKWQNDQTESLSLLQRLKSDMVCRTRLWFHFDWMTPGSWCYRKWLPPSE